MKESLEQQHSEAVAKLKASLVSEAERKVEQMRSVLETQHKQEKEKEERKHKEEIDVCQ